MSENRPYAFGDVVDGHRWTMAGWERVDPQTPGPVVDLTDSARREPVRVAAEPVRVAAEPAPEPVRYDIGDGVEAHHWDGLSWGTVSQPVAEPVPHFLATPPELTTTTQEANPIADWADAVRWSTSDPTEDPHVSVEPEVRAVFSAAEPAAGWYPGRTTAGDQND